MSKIRHNFMLFFMLTKRLFKKPSFTVILALIVAVTGIMSIALSRHSNIVRVAIVNGNTSPDAARITEQLLSSNGAVSYSLTDSDTAYSLLNKGDADAVFEFAEDFEGAVAAFACGDKEARPARLTVREKNIFLMLTSERLYAEIFPYVGKEIYNGYLAENFNVTDKNLLDELFNGQPQLEKIVEISYYNASDRVEDNDFLVTPLRGLLSVILSLCSMACVLYFLDDSDNGHLDSVPLSARWLRVSMYAAAGTVSAAVFVMTAICVSGLAVELLTELVCAVLLTVASVGFATLVGGIAGKTARMAPVLPIILIAMLFLCPIFLNSEIPILPSLFAPYWYLGAVYNSAMTVPFAIYCAVVNLLSYTVWKIRLKA